MTSTTDPTRTGLSTPPAELRRGALTLLQPGFVGLTAPHWLLRALEDGLGGVALFARNIERPEQVAALTASIHAANPAALVSIDEEGGDVTRLQHATGSSWPGNLALGVADDPALTQRVAAEMGAALAAVGIDLDYAPDADVNVNAANPVIGVRSFGDDPARVARHTAAWVRGLQSAGVLACAKHFPGHGDTDTDSHLSVPEIDLINPSTSSSLVPFRAAIGAGVASIMSAHVRVPSLDPRPATLAPAVMTGLLRDQLGFGGLAVSDGLEMGAVADSVGLIEGAVLAVAAGVDALCVGGGLADEGTVDALVSGLTDAVVDGRLPAERLSEAAERVAAAAALRDRIRIGSATAIGRTEHGIRSVRTSAGLEAGRRSLRVSGPVRRSPEVPLVVELTTRSNIAVGDATPAGVATAARDRWPDLSVVRLGETDATARGVAEVARLAGRAPLWLVIRDPHRHPWMATAATTFLAERPDTVVIEIGWPGWVAPQGAVHLLTHGSSWAGGQAVVDLLTP